jgi:hypothetical protein
MRKLSLITACLALAATQSGKIDSVVAQREGSAVTMPTKPLSEVAVIMPTHRQELAVIMPTHRQELAVIMPTHRQKLA